MSGIYEATDRNFEQVIGSHGLVLIDFWGDGCVPCKMMEPVINGIGSRFGNTLRVAKANIKSCASIAKKYNILSIPTLMLFKRGALVQKYSGVVKEEMLRRKIQENM